MYAKTGIDVSCLDEALNAAQDGIFIYNKDSSILYANRAACELCGMPINIFKDKVWTWRELEDSGYFYGEAALAALESGQRISTEFTNHIGIHMLCTATPILDKNRVPYLVVTNVRDITRLSELQNDLQKKKTELNALKNELNKQNEQGRKKFIYTSPQMRQVVNTLDRVASMDITVLLLGGSGVGKSELAVRIHQKSNRAAQKFIVVNCGAIPESLCEAEFFGYEKGAFTGAYTARKGCFEEADGGTLFLDEIGELPLVMQVKLLRVLQEGKVKRLGSQKEIPVNVRLLAATNQDIKQKVLDKSFRDDLYHRINVITLYIPPLKERPADVTNLISYFLARFNSKYGLSKTMSPQLISTLETYAWPGNAREIEHLIERMVILSTTDEIGCEYLPHDFHANSSNEQRPLTTLQEARVHAEKELLQAAKQRLGSTRKMAKALNVSHVTIAKKLKEYGLE